MSIEKKTCAVDDLRVGMYVSELDRPWLETPFLFQGFQIDCAETIEQLRQYCKFVYVDVERSEELPEPRRFKPPPRGAVERVPESTTRSVNHTARTVDAEGDLDASIVPLKNELVQARVAHTKAEKLVGDLFRRIRGDEKIELSSIEQTLDPMIDSIIRNDDAMSWLARMKRKNDYVYDHSLASSVWAMMFGKHLGLGAEELQMLGMGAVFMDVGKTKIPTALLTKRERLSPEETRVMRRHVEHSVAIVSKIEGIDPRVIEMVQFHHERYNGTGYPQGLSGSQIPVFARIAGVVDAYDAMTTARPYAEAKSTHDAMRLFSKLAGVEFAEEMIEQFVQAIGVFPVGALVELNTGQVGIVVAQNRVRRLRPKIMIVLDHEKAPLESCPIVDLRNQQVADVSGDSLWIERGLAPGEYGIDPSEYYL